MKQEKIYCAYIMASKRNGTLYIGVTSNPQKRIYEYKNDLVEGFTKKYQVHLLMHLEMFNDSYTAISREKQLKRWNREWKLNLIEKKNSSWKDLYDKLF